MEIIERHYNNADMILGAELYCSPFPAVPCWKFPYTHVPGTFAYANGGFMVGKVWAYRKVLKYTQDLYSLMLQVTNHSLNIIKMINYFGMKLTFQASLAGNT